MITRVVACKNPHYAYYYARYIDKKSRNDTRIAACKNPESAYYYARDVDKSFYQDTYEATLNTYCEKYYKQFLNKLMKEEII